MVTCEALVEAITTTTNTIPATNVASDTLPPATITSTSLRTTTTTVTTATEVDTTVTITSTQSTAATTTATFSTSTIVTATVAGPAATIYAACQANNLLFTANGGQYFSDFDYSYVSNDINEITYTSDVDCCAACQNSDNCVGFVTMPNLYETYNPSTRLCYNFVQALNVPNTCDGANNHGIKGYTNSAATIQQAYTFGDGPCGQIMDGGSES